MRALEPIGGVQNTIGAVRKAARPIVTHVRKGGHQVSQVASVLFCHVQPSNGPYADSWTVLPSQALRRGVLSVAIDYSLGDIEQVFLDDVGLIADWQRRVP
jgi:hypothetical protein